MMYIESLLLAVLAVRAISGQGSDSKGALLPRSMQKRPRAPLHDLRSVKMVRRQMSTTQCGDGSSHAVDISALVQDAVQAGLPSASDTGVLFMRVSVSAAELCGPYTCFVSPDATGFNWQNMNILTDVPSIATGQCRASPEGKEISLVAQIPSQTTCSGPGGACLVMCKNEVQTQGSCAAISFNSAGSSAQPSASNSAAPSQGSSEQASPIPQMESSSTTSVHSAPSPNVLTSIIVSSVDVTPETTYTQIVTQPISLPSSSSTSPSSSISLSSTTRGAPTIVGFSGENSPGGYADQFGGPGNPVVLGSHAGTSQSAADQQSAASTGRAVAKIATCLGILVALIILI